MPGFRPLMLTQAESTAAGNSKARIRVLMRAFFSQIAGLCGLVFVGEAADAGQVLAFEVLKGSAAAG